MPVAVGIEATSTDIQQAIFGAPPSSLPVPVSVPAPKAVEAVQDAGRMNVDGDEGSKGVKRDREEESDDEGVAMDEDSDAPMDASSDEDD